MIVDIALLLFARLSPRFFSIALIIRYPGYLRHMGISRKRLLRKLRKKSYFQSGYRDDFSETWLITVQPHMREKTILKTFGQRITRIITLGDEGLSAFANRDIALQSIPRDWIAAWLLILANFGQERLFILSGLSDLWFMPLKVHMHRTHMAFDAYDTIAEYKNGALMPVLNRLNYRLGRHYFIRDARFKQALRRSGNWSTSVCYVPDAMQMDVIEATALIQKFQPTEKIKFVSAGWVTTEGDGGILRSFKLIRSIWPQAELHLCLTQFMRQEDPLFAPLIAYMSANEGCHVHANLQGEAYQTMLDEAHVGLNLHDPNVFDESYADFSAAMVRRSPSARILDFAARGCVLMTTKEQRYSQHVFKLHSPHKAVIHLTPKTRPEELTALFDGIRTRAQ